MLYNCCITRIPEKTILNIVNELAVEPAGVLYDVIIPQYEERDNGEIQFRLRPSIYNLLCEYLPPAIAHLYENPAFLTSFSEAQSSHGRFVFNKSDGYYLALHKTRSLCSLIYTQGTREYFHLHASKLGWFKPYSRVSIHIARTTLNGIEESLHINELSMKTRGTQIDRNNLSCNGINLCATPLVGPYTEESSAIADAQQEFASHIIKEKLSPSSPNYLFKAIFGR